MDQPRRPLSEELSRTRPSAGAGTIELLWYECAVAADVADHLAAFDCLDDCCGAIERRCGLLQLREAVGDTADRGDPTTIMTALRIFFLIFDLGGRLISIVLYFKKFLESCNSLVERAAMRARR
jgi:hypothetical protein